MDQDTIAVGLLKRHSGFGWSVKYHSSPSIDCPRRMRETPPKPRFSLTVGVIGHRPNRLPPEVVERVAAQIGTALTAVAKAAADAHLRYADFFTADGPKLSVATSLAEGADRLGAGT